MERNLAVTWEPFHYSGPREYEGIRTARRSTVIPVGSPAGTTCTDVGGDDMIGPDHYSHSVLLFHA